MNAAFPARYACPPTAARTPRPACASNVSALGMRRYSACWARSTTACARGCSLPGLNRRSLFQAGLLRSWQRSSSNNIGHGRMAGGNGSGFIQYTTVSTACRFSRLSADLIKMPHLGGLARSHHDGHRRGQPQRARDRRSPARQMALDRANSKLCPTNSQTMAVSSGDADHHRHEYAADFIRQPGDRRFGIARFVHQPDDLGQAWCRSPTLEAWNRKVPFLLMVAEITGSPGHFSLPGCSPR